jgi:RNA polymerase sporulation-specific sigma factor
MKNGEGVRGAEWETDEELIARVHRGDPGATEAVLNKYKGLVKLKARAYFMVGADREDIVQEGMIGLYKAIRDYNPEKAAYFYSFAELCITRQMITAVKAATRQKHMPLNFYLSLNKAYNDGEYEKTYMDMLTASGVSNPEELLIGREDRHYIERHMGEMLSHMECRVLALYLQEKSYAEIARALSKDEKSVDNALQRVRRKLEKKVAQKQA